MARGPVTLELTTLSVDSSLKVELTVLRCPRCWGRDIVPSLPKGILDRVMKKLDRVPCQCRFCAHRFYRPERQE